MKNRSGPERGAWSRRPSFTPRQMLTAEQLNAGLADELMRQQLLSRAVHGYGVVLGFALSVDDDGALDLRRGCLELSGGLALDRHGRMLLWEGGRLGIADLVGPPPRGPGWYTLCAHYARRAPQDEDCRGEDPHWAHDGVVFSLHRGCRGVDRDCPDHPHDRCLSHDEYLGVRTGGLPGDPESPDVEWLLREPGPMRPTGDDEWEYDPDPEVCVPLACVRICDLAAKDDPDQHPGKDDGKDPYQYPQDDGEHGGKDDGENGGKEPYPEGKDPARENEKYPQKQEQDAPRTPDQSYPDKPAETPGEKYPGKDRNDPKHPEKRPDEPEHRPEKPDRWDHGGHPGPRPDPCDPRYGFCPKTEPDTVSVRPFVYRNPLLYELTSCCDTDLPRVRSVSWQDWLDGGWSTPVPWRAFEERLTSGGLEVWFTRPLDPRTLHEASVFVTAFYQQDDASWLSYRVPLAEVTPLGRADKDGDAEHGDHGDGAWGARLVLDDEWLGAEVTGRRSNLFAGARIEITVRGQLLRDRCGRMLDARPPGLKCGVRCQSRPGDDLVTAFQVERRTRRKGGYSPDEADTGSAT
ncbi:hypothetical protein [Georgenia muralis]